MPDARIYQKGKSATQSGKRDADLWILEHEPLRGRRPEPLMGWVGGGDTDQQVRLTFPTLAAATDYAARHGLEAEVLPPTPRPLILKSYADNFR